tara:strand:+ start:1529 stop:1765 length:237 start_codon:yes stop_codon:yes gene_type:complete
MSEEELFLQMLVAEKELQILITQTIFGIVALGFVALFLYVSYLNPDARRKRKRKKDMSYRQQRRRDIRVARKMRGNIR